MATAEESIELKKLVESIVNLTNAIIVLTQRCDSVFTRHDQEIGELKELINGFKKLVDEHADSVVNDGSEVELDGMESNSTPNLGMEENGECDFLLKDHAMAMIQCKIKHTQYEGGVVAVLRTSGSKGSVQVNRALIKRGAICVLKSRDEVAFDGLGNHAFIFHLTKVAVKSAEVHSILQKNLQLERFDLVYVTFDPGGCDNLEDK
ncbi:unnamed protein product, partial [Dovyalis caffra]